MAAAEVIGLMNGDGLRLAHAGADAVRALPLLAPLRACDETGAREHGSKRRIDLLAQYDARGVGKQQRIPEPAMCS